MPKGSTAERHVPTLRVKLSTVNASTRISVSVQADVPTAEEGGAAVPKPAGCELIKVGTPSCGGLEMAELDWRALVLVSATACTLTAASIFLYLSATQSRPRSPSPPSRSTATRRKMTQLQDKQGEEGEMTVHDKQGD